MGYRLGIVLAVLAAAASITTWASAGRAAVGYSFSARGIETALPVGGVSTFSGAAIGTGGVAVWSATVPHAPLSSCGATEITRGGTFTLAGTHGVRLSGTFTGGAVTAPDGYCTGGRAPCATETFTLTGSLTVNGALPASFVGRLSHFSTTVFGICVTYFATISGHLAVGSSR